MPIRLDSPRQRRLRYVGCVSSRGSAAMQRPLLASIVTLAVMAKCVLAIGSIAGAQPFDADAGSRVLEGERAFNAECASCHRVGGDAEQAAPDFTTGSFLTVKGRAAIAEVIRDGIDGTAMQGLRKASPYTVDQLATYTEWLNDKAEDCESPTDASGRLLCPSVGQELISRGDLEAWETLPRILPLQGRGDRTPIQANARYVVRDVRTVSSLLTGTRYYLRVEDVDPQEATCRERACWVYQGAAGSEELPNLLPPP